MKESKLITEPTLEAALARAFDDLRTSIYCAMVVQTIGVSLALAVVFTLG